MNKKEQTEIDEQYKNIGKFIVEFNMICHHLQTGIIFLLEKEGLNNQQLANIVVSNYAADDLQSILRSMIYELNEFNDKEDKIIKNIFSRIDKLIKIRNDIAHGVLFVGYGVPDKEADFSQFTGYKLHRNAKGSDTKILKYDQYKFESFIEEASNVATLTMRMYLCIFDNFKLENNFDFDAYHNVIVGVRKGDSDNV